MMARKRAAASRTNVTCSWSSKSGESNTVMPGTGADVRPRWWMQFLRSTARPERPSSVTRRRYDASRGHAFFQRWEHSHARALERDGGALAQQVPRRHPVDRRAYDGDRCAWRPRPAEPGRDGSFDHARDERGAAAAAG